MALQVVTPADMPVTLEEAKAHLRLEGAGEDSLVVRLIESGAEKAQEETRRQLCTATLRLVIDAFPCGREIELPRPPLQRVVSIEYYDADGTLQTLPSGAYHVDDASTPGRVVRAAGTTWPTTQCRPGAVRIEYDAGYGAPETVPARIKSAILLDVGDGYAYRETNVVGTVSSELKRTVDDLLRPFKVWAPPRE